MRIPTNIFLLIAVFFISIEVINAQPSNISLEINRQKRGYVLQQLQKVSGYTFVYSKSDINTAEIISVSIKNKPVTEALKMVIGNNYSFERIGPQIAIKALQPPKKITPPAHISSQKILLQVIDKTTGDPLPYATVSIQPIDKSFVTGENGSVSFYHSFSRIPSLLITATYVNKAATQIRLTAENSANTVRIPLPEISLSLNKIEVNAKRQKAQSNSSVIIER